MKRTLKRRMHTEDVLRFRTVRCDECGVIQRAYLHPLIHEPDGSHSLNLDAYLITGRMGHPPR